MNGVETTDDDRDQDVQNNKSDRQPKKGVCIFDDGHKNRLTKNGQKKDEDGASDDERPHDGFRILAVGVFFKPKSKHPPWADGCVVDVAGFSA